MKTTNFTKLVALFSTLFFFIISSFNGLNATVYPINVTLSGTQEVPSNSSTATGTLIGNYDDATNTLTYTVTFSGLTANVTAAHFHAAPPGIAAAVLIPATGFPTGVTSGNYMPAPLVLTDSQEDSLKLGLFYFNIHNASFPGGEIRAQVFLQDASFVVPDITCPSDTTLDAEMGKCSAVLKFDASASAGTPLSSFYYRIGNTTIPSTYDFLVGTTKVVATALNAAGYDTCVFNVTVNDVEPPVITCPADITQSNDPGECGAIVNFEAMASDNCTNVTISYDHDPGTFFDVGTTIVTATAKDDAGNTSSCSFNVIVNDTEPPVIENLKVDPSRLWAPNHKLRNIAVNYDESDNCEIAECHLSVESDEPVNGFADGNTFPDWIIDPNDNHHLKVRSERSGRGDGRVYTITVTCTDIHGNSASASATVEVPHNQQGHISRNTLVLNEASEDGQEDGLVARVQPNPSSSYFALNIQAANTGEKFSIRIFDVSGRNVETRNNLSGSQTLRIGEKYKAGVYFAEIKQGDEIGQLKLIKMQ